MVDGIIIRNIWPTHLYQLEWIKVETSIAQSNIYTYNPLIGKGDRMGKKYLIALFKSKYAVIPSVERVEDLLALGAPEYYWIKPQFGCDGFGASKVNERKLKKLDLTGYIIQPYVEFSDEPSFFFIDNIFVYAITMPNRLLDNNIEQYEPTPEEIEWARSFVEWNDLPYGIQRIDAVRTRDGQLLLTEIEDLCPYLYLESIDPVNRENVLHKLKESILRNMDDRMSYTEPSVASNPHPVGPVVV